MNKLFILYINNKGYSNNILYGIGKILRLFYCYSKPNIFLVRLIINIFSILTFLKSSKKKIKVNIIRLIFFIKNQLLSLNIRIFKPSFIKNINNNTIFKIKNIINLFIFSYGFILNNLLFKPSFIIV